MNVKQMLEKLARILNDEHDDQLRKYKSLKKVLKSLRKEHKALQAQLDHTNDPEHKQHIESRLKIIVAQREKGLKVLKQLKQERRKSS